MNDQKSHNVSFNSHSHSCRYCINPWTCEELRLLTTGQAHDVPNNPRIAAVTRDDPRIAPLTIFLITGHTILAESFPRHPSGYVSCHCHCPRRCQQHHSAISLLPTHLKHHKRFHVLCHSQPTHSIIHHKTMTQSPQLFLVIGAAPKHRKAPHCLTTHWSDPCRRVGPTARSGTTRRPLTGSASATYHHLSLGTHRSWRT